MAQTQSFLRFSDETFDPQRPEIAEAESRDNVQGLLDEHLRLKILHNLEILDSDHETEFDELAALAAEICDAPISLVSLVDHERQWFKAAIGLSVTETHRDYSFCAHAINDPGLFVVENALSDERFCDNPLVLGSPHIRFYAGVPLHVHSGAIGTLCVIDTKPRTLTAGQRKALAILARQVQSRIELRSQRRKLEETLAENLRLSATLESSRNTFRAFMDHGPFVSYIKDAHGKMIFYNAGLANQFQITQTEWLGKLDHEIWPPALAQVFRDIDAQVLERDAPIETVDVYPAVDGGQTHWKTLKFPIVHESGERMLAGISLDISDQYRKQADLQEVLLAKDAAIREAEANRTLLRTFNDNSPHLVYLKSEDGRYLSYNQAFAEFFGIDRQAWIGRSPAEVLPAASVESFRAHDLQVLQFNRRIECCDYAIAAAGRKVVLRSVKFPITGTNGERLIGGVDTDISAEVQRQTALEKANEELKKLARTDALTGLYSRRVFDDRMEREYALADRSGRSLAVIMIDIDDFKKRNDQFGHAAGDDALRAVGRLLRMFVRTGEVASRVGGEEFAILLPEVGVSGASAFAERIQAALRLLECASGQITASMGIAFKDNTAHTWEDVVAYSDKAMYYAKRNGKNKIAIYRGADKLPMIVREDVKVKSGPASVPLVEVSNIAAEV